MDPITITGITAGQVGAWLGRVLPHRGTDETLAVLTRVQITVGDGYLLAAATDRYTLGVARLQASTTVTTGRIQFIVPGAWAVELADELPGGRDAIAPAALTVTDTAVTLSTDTLVIAGTDEICYDGDDFPTVPTWESGADPQWTRFFDWESTARTLLAAPADPRPVHVAPGMLARFAESGAVILDPAGAAPLTVHQPGPGLPPLAVHYPGGQRALVVLGADFLGLLLPLRLEPDQQAAAPAAPDSAVWHATWRDRLTPQPAAAPV